MTGIAGGTVDGEVLGRMAATLEHEDWYEYEQFESGELGLGLQHHGEKDPHGYSFWTDGQTAGAIDGAVSNRSELGWSVSTIFERLLQSPEQTLEAIEGPFTIVCIDAADDRILLATDKIGSRPPMYSTENGFVFGSRLATIIEIVDDPTVDLQGVSDMLLMGHLWSDTTLLEEAKTLHPATVIEYHDGEITERRYWHPGYDQANTTDEYFHELTNSFQQTVDRTANAVAGDIGLWLSGGLDSRATISELARNHESSDTFDSLTTYTYDANPGGGVNPRLATEVAETLELPNETVPLSPDQFLPVLEKSVDVTDGMVNWNTFLNLSAVYNIEKHDPDILMEGIVGELIGQHLCRYHLTEASSLVDSMYRSEASRSTDDVDDLLDANVDPLGSYRKEARRTDESSFGKAIVDTHFQNYYPRLAHASNPVPRSQVGTRVPYADGDFLSRAAKLPLSWRMGSLPFTEDKLIYGVVKPKIRMMQTLNRDLAEIPYERSRLKPTYPYPLHIAGFFTSTALSRLKSQRTYGGKSMAGEWYRNHDQFQKRLDGLIDDACKRSFLNATAIRECQQRHLQEESEEIKTLSAITTLELWLQRHFD